MTSRTAPIGSTTGFAKHSDVLSLVSGQVIGTLAGLGGGEQLRLDLVAGGQQTPALGVLADDPGVLDVVIAVGDAYQQATDWHLRVPAELG